MSVSLLKSSGNVVKYYSTSDDFRYDAHTLHTSVVNFVVTAFGFSQWKQCSVVDPDPNPYVLGPPVFNYGSVIILHGSESLNNNQKSKKNLISTIFWLLFWLLFMKTDVNVPLKNYEENLIKNLFFVGILSAIDE